MIVRLGIGEVPAVWQFKILIWNRSQIMFIRSSPPLSCIIVTFIVRVGDKYVIDVKEVFFGVVSKESGFDAFNFFGDAWAVI